MYPVKKFSVSTDLLYNKYNLQMKGVN